MDHRHQQAQGHDAGAVTFHSWRKDGTTWCHTAGLTALGFPELIATGLANHGEPFLRRAVGDLTRRSGAVDGDTTDAVADRDVMYRSLPVERAGIYAIEAANRDPGRFHALQVVWPDQNGAWPWSPDCDPDVARSQSIVVAFEPPGAPTVRG